MALKKIRLEELSHCPACGGTSGIKYDALSYARIANAWGNQPDQEWIVNHIKIQKEIKTVRCMDCDKRFRLEKS
jgi:hypothetical protein